MFLLVEAEGEGLVVIVHLAEGRASDSEEVTLRRIRERRKS